MRLDWNESPLGPPPAAVARLRAHAADLHLYPRGLLEEVTADVARDSGAEPEAVLLVNGVDEAIDLVLGLVPGCRYVTPGFDAYAERARVLGRTARPIPLDAGWQPAGLPEPGGAVFLAQPHNPTGGMFPAAWVRQVLEAAEVLVLDTTYADFAAQPYPVETHPRLLVFRSFSKSHGLAGLRVGALTGSPRLIGRLRERTRFHSVDSAALHALAGALADPGHRARLRAHVLAERPRYAAELGRHPAIGEVRDTEANFVLARPREGLVAGEVAKRLAEHDVWVRDCGPLGLPGWLRVTVGTVDDLARLAGALTLVQDC
ncbi:pyridoxal phosphate-dependent aminotransferase [Nonomuraea typhae]|uniref:pyridoxal phosphate-dependent aminotransferase n=1 Tax=Nonomuraea typhae TaxID=2603600 RepID=UPI0012FABA9F|nr:histidinol-phosphate transaminase [Nonomuraea typhae]